MIYEGRMGSAGYGDCDSGGESREHFGFVELA